MAVKKDDDMEVYLDNSATTRAYPEVGDLVRRVMCEDYGNPSSMHRKGVEAEHYIRDAKAELARLMKVNAKEIFFTSGGTESDNLALAGCARAARRSGNHLITTSVEHDAVLRTMKNLEQEGFRVTYLPVDHEGRVKLDALSAALCPETTLVSIMYVNNEIGTREPVEEASRIVKAYNPSILFHTDAVQGFGKYRIYPKRQGIDLLSASGHKIHGPKGTGVLYIGEHVKISPILFGGGQQKDIRPGTENVPGIAGLALAAKMSYENLAEKTARMRSLREYFIEKAGKIEGARVHGASGEDSAPHIISIGFAKVRSEVLQHALEDKGIYVSSGSACASNHPDISAVLKSIDVGQEYLHNTVRFSMSEFTTREEIDYTLEILYNTVSMLKKYTRY